MSDDYDWDDFPVIAGQGSLHDLRDADSPDPRNPRLAAFRSVSYAGAVGLAKPTPKPRKAQRRVGFIHRRP